jgi:hypothetical protein
VATNVRTAYGSRHKIDKDEMKRYNLAIPESLFEQVQEFATQDHITVALLLRKYIKWGLVIDLRLRNPNAVLIIREGDRDTELLPVF